MIGTPPNAAAPQPPLTGEAAVEYGRRRVQGPAIGLIVVGALMLLPGLMLGVWMAITLSFTMAGPGSEAILHRAMDTLLRARK